MVRKLVLAVAAASALMSSNMALALGVGNINLRSALNQPLDAEIELLQVRDLSSNEILPRLASPDDFGRAGIDRGFFLTDLQFTPEVRSDGRAVIRVTSTQPVREPFLNFLLDVRWPSGRVLREFTLLLDPPLYQPGPVTSQTVQPPVSAPSVSRPVPAAAPVAPPSRPSAPAVSTAPRPAPTAADGQLRTNPSDTLWEIAQRNRPQGATVHQTMLAILDLNPGAFINGNINQMRANQTLTMPDSSQASRRSQSEAIEQVADQNAAWRTGRQTAAAAAPAQRQLDARERQTAAPAPATAPASDSLRLVAGTGDEGGSGDLGGAGRERQLQDALDRAKEQLDSAESERLEMSSRLQDVQAQLETLQRLMALKDAQLAALQQQLGQDGEATDPASPAAPVDGAVSAAPESDLAALEATQAQLQDEQGDAQVATDAAESTEALEPVAPVAEPQPEVAPAEVAPAPVEPAAVEEEGGIEQILQGLLQNQTLVLAVGGAALLVLLMLLMALARRNARREEEYSTHFIAGTAAPAEQGKDGEFNLALASFNEAADESPFSDVITDVDGLIAYGKLSEASEMLSDAINAEPHRADYRLKLMEVKALQEDQRGYVEQAEKLHDMGGSEQQITALNTRFPAMAAGLLGGSAVINDMDEGFDIDLDIESGKSPAPADDDLAMDFDFNEFESDVLSSESDLAEPQAPVAEPATAETETPVELSSETDFDLDFDLDEDLADELSSDQPVETAMLDADFDLSLEDLEAEAGVEPESPLEAELDRTVVDAGDELSLDEDFDLSLTEDLQSDQLLAELDASTEEVRFTPDADLGQVDADGENSGFSDEDLAGFEAELSAAIESDTAAANETPASVDLPDALDPFVEDRPASEAIGDSMDDEFDFLSGTDECATKLDLARAYIDMGDEEGARDILSEVVEEGNDQQKKDASDMLAQLS
jgi:pilus assembly protein FimV